MSSCELWMEQERGPSAAGRSRQTASFPSPHLMNAEQNPCSGSSSSSGGSGSFESVRKLSLTTLDVILSRVACCNDANVCDNQLLHANLGSLRPLLFLIGF
ncbi:uncharacterized protein V6R79_002834 [Siganus canaliculatus]